MDTRANPDHAAVPDCPGCDAFLERAPLRESVRAPGFAQRLVAATRPLLIGMLIMMAGNLLQIVLCVLMPGMTAAALVAILQELIRAQRRTLGVAAPPD